MRGCGREDLSIGVPKKPLGGVDSAEHLLYLKNCLLGGAPT